MVRKLQQLDPIEAGKLSRSKNCPTKALGFKAGELCELKSIIFAKLGDMSLSDNWIQVGTQLFRNAHVLLSRFYLELSNYRGSPDSTNFGSQDNRVIRGIVLIGD